MALENVMYSNATEIYTEDKPRIYKRDGVWRVSRKPIWQMSLQPSKYVRLVIDYAGQAVMHCIKLNEAEYVAGKDS